MLLKNANNLIFFDTKAVGNFVIVNISNFSYFEFFVMHYTISHYNSFSGFDVLFNLFSGNNYFIFLNKHSYYDNLLDLFSDDGSNFELLAVSWNNYFVNYSNGIFNISNSIFLVFFNCMFFIYLFFSLFFSKLMTICVKTNLSESKDWC